MRVLGLNSDPQAWLQAPLPTEPYSLSVALKLLMLPRHRCIHSVLWAAFFYMYIIEVSSTINSMLEKKERSKPQKTKPKRKKTV